MSFNDFLDHKCNIFHSRRTDKSPGYGLPASPSFSHPETPDLTDIPCHFGTKGATVTITRAEPQTKYEAKIKLTLPTDTDIRINDKVVDCDTRYEYTAGLPRNIRGHHITVIVYRTSQQEPL